MDWDGSTVYTLWGYRPNTRPAIKWIQVANGFWKGNDRGASEDIIESSIVFKGPETELNDLETVLDSNRETFSIDCGTGEEIFGADIDYSGSLTVSVVDYGRPRRVSFGQFSMAMKLRLPSPTYTGSASIADLRLADFRYIAASDFDMIKQFTLDGTSNYLDGQTDPGVFQARFLQTQDEMKAIRRYLLTTARTAAISFPSIGVDEPYGQREGSGPFNCKVIKWNDQGRVNYRDWLLNITFARDVDP